VWLTRRGRDPFIDQAGREALNFGISIAIYGSVLLIAALLLVGIPLLIAGVIAWVVLGSLAAAKASQGQHCDEACGPGAYQVTSSDGGAGAARPARPTDPMQGTRPVDPRVRPAERAPRPSSSRWIQAQWPPYTV
jgi:uncharacterized Tic20 family protein